MEVHPIIEKVAKALAEQDGHDWHDMPPYREGYYRNAKAAAKVILSAEPTEAMLDSGVAFALNVTIGGDYRWTDYVRDKHKAMTTALRSEMGIE